MQSNMMPPFPMQGPSNQQAKFSLRDSRPLTCECGHEIFREAFLMRTVSRLVTGQAQDTMLHIPIMVCDKCGVIYKDLLPPELKGPEIV